MDLGTAFSQINWLSVIVANLAAFAIGSVWYSPVLFGKIWQKEVNLSDEELKDTNMIMMFGVSFLLSFVAAVVLDMFLGRDATWDYGLTAGLLVGVAWIATSIGTNYLYSRKSFRLFLIDAGYFAVFYPAMGVILGAWS
jgi:hypothetical protein